jgi:hypothetical protein
MFEGSPGQESAGFLPPFHSTTMRISVVCIGIMAGRDLRESGSKLPEAFIPAKVGDSQPGLVTLLVAS